MTFRFPARAALLTLLVATPVYPCGGPALYEVQAPMLAAERHLEAIELGDAYWDPTPRSELRFLAPFFVAGVPGVQALWQSAYPGWDAPYGMRLDTTATFAIDDAAMRLDSAFTRGSRAEIRTRASAVVAASLAAPSIVADEHAASLRRAVEALEVLPVVPEADERTMRTVFDPSTWFTNAAASMPSWAREVVAIRKLPRDSMGSWGRSHATSPRRPSLEWVALREAVRTGIPDGWANEFRDSVPKARWRELESLHADWLKRWAEHPLAPWVKLSRARLAYFEGDTATAWNVVFELYPKAPLRALAEMRYLLQQGMEPALDDPRVDDTLRAALLTAIDVAPDEWTRLWQQASAAKDAPWARTMRDRLMQQAAHGVRDANSGGHAPFVLPAGFPDSPNGLSTIGATFRLVALMRAGRLPAAIAQSEALGAVNDTTATYLAPLRAHLALWAKRWQDALAVRGLAPEARDYVLTVVAPDSVLAAVAEKGDGRISRQAKWTRATRLALAGDWSSAAAALPSAESARRPRWLEAARLAADTSLDGRLAYARWLRGRAGALLGTPDRTWYRSLNWRLEALQDTTAEGGTFDLNLPFTRSDEANGIARQLMATYESYHAVRAYAGFLDRIPKGDPRRVAVVREADAVYRRLVDFDNNNSRFWQRELERQGIGSSIRRAGARR